MMKNESPEMLDSNQQALSIIYSEIIEMDLMETLSKLDIYIKEIKRLIEMNCEIEDIFLKISVLKFSLNHVACLLLGETVKRCIAEQIGNENENIEEFDKLMLTIGRILKV
jgi:DNA-binding FrmR family transcriptional regulator